MKTVRILILTLLLLCAALVLTACNVGNGVPSYLLGLTASTTDSAASTTDAAEVKSDEAKIVAAEGFTLDGTTLSVTLPNAVDSLSLPDKIAVSEGATWQVSSDRLGRQIVAEKTLSLAEGDNVFYVFVTAEDGKTVGARNRSDPHGLRICRMGRRLLRADHGKPDRKGTLDAQYRHRLYRRVLSGKRGGNRV